MEDIGARVRWCRGRHGWTQRDLAAATGVGLATIRRIEQRAFAPRLETVRRLAARLRVREGWLAFGEAPMLDPGDLTPAERRRLAGEPGGDRLVSDVGASAGADIGAGPWYGEWRVERRSADDEGSGG